MSVAPRSAVWIGPRAVCSVATSPPRSLLPPGRHDRGTSRQHRVGTLAFVTTVVRLRVEIDDTPGSLAEVAGVLADHGGNITAIDVHQDGRLSAVDEMTVEFPDQVDLTLVRTEVARRTRARVVSHQT